MSSKPPQSLPKSGAAPFALPRKPQKTPAPLTVVHWLVAPSVRAAAPLDCVADHMDVAAGGVGTGGGIGGIDGGDGAVMFNAPRLPQCTDRWPVTASLPGPVEGEQTGPLMPP